MVNKNYIGILDTKDSKEIETMEYIMFGKETVDNWKNNKNKKTNNKNKFAIK